MAKLNAYLMFNGNCREAMEFYKDCFGGKLDVMTHGDSPMAAQVQPELKSKVMHSFLESGNIALMASDCMEACRQGDAIFLCLVCDSKEEIEQLYKKLSTGGKVRRPLKEEFFGTYGELSDKYGFLWMFQYGTGQMK